MEKHDVCGQFGRRVRALRHKRGLTQEKLGELAELDRTFVNQVEAGKRNVTLATIHRLADALDVDPGELVTEARSADR